MDRIAQAKVNNNRKEQFLVELELKSKMKQITRQQKNSEINEAQKRLEMQQEILANLFKAKPQQPHARSESQGAAFEDSLISRQVDES